MSPKARILCVMGCLVGLGGVVARSTAGLAPAPGAALEGLRRSGDEVLQRRHAWMLFDALTRSTGTRGSEGSPGFESWWGEGAVFARSSATAVPGIQGFARAAGDAGSVRAAGHETTAAGEIPVLAYTLYNQAAYDHIRRHRLYLRGELQRLREAGPVDATMPGQRSVPSFPVDAMIVKTAWWPVAERGLTALPVWDGDREQPRRAGNDYLTWKRILAVDADPVAGDARVPRLEFAGRSFADVQRVPLRDFHQVTLDADLARRLGQDASASKLAVLVLGRPLHAGDHLVLVAANLATREIADWIWAAYWWHDSPADGTFAADRPASLPAPWRHFLMQVAFDDSTPLSADGSARICFNPWLEARFPDGGAGAGVTSNCLACHRRASFPPAAFLPVTRGQADLARDPAYARGQLRVSFNWSLALHALP